MSAVMKICTACDQAKELSEFGKHKAGAGGLRPTCKACCKLAWAAYVSKNKEKRALAQAEYREKNKDTIRAADFAYREKNKERELARGAAWRAAHPEKERARTAAYRNANKAKDAARKAEYARNNPDVVRAIASRRRARVKGAVGTHTAADIQHLKQIQRSACAVCRADISESYHVDHVLPLALGGTNGKENLQLLCPTCNHSKSCKHPIDFMQQKGFLL